jgi:hypothetical protein
MPDVSKPLLLLWGDSDPMTPADGPVGRYMAALPTSRPNTTFVMLPGKRLDRSPPVLRLPNLVSQ